QARPAGTILANHAKLMANLVQPSEADRHLEQFHVAATWTATITALSGFFLAVVFYGLRLADASEVRHQFGPIYNFLVHKWYFDELYDAIFVRPVMFVSRRVADFDKKVIDRFIDALAKGAVMIARLDDLIDRYIVDGLVNLFADWTYALGIS